MSDLVTTALPGELYQINCCGGDKMCFVFRDDLSPEDLAKLSNSVQTWTPPEYCLVIHFP